MSPFITSMLISVGTVLCSLIIGVPLAVLLVKTDFPGKKVLKHLYLAPLFIPPSIMALTWIGMVGEIKLLYSVYGSIMLLTLCYFPFVTLLSIGGIGSVGRDIEESARLEYNMFGVLRHVTLPYAAKHILAGALFVFVFAISNYEIPALLGVHTFPVEIFAQFSVAYNYKLAFLLSLPLGIVCLGVIVLAGWIMQDKDYIAVSADWQKPWKVPLTKMQQVGVTGWVVTVVVVTTVVPIFTLISKAGNCDVYMKAFTQSRSELGMSLVLAIIGSAVITVLGFIAAYFIERSSSLWKHVLYYLSIIPFAIPATVVGVALIKVFNRPAFNLVYTTPLILVIGYLIRFTPFAIRLMCASISQVNVEMEEAAKIGGAGFFRKLFCVLMPMCWPAIIISFAIMFALIIGEIGTTVLVAPAGTGTLIVKIYNLMHYGANKIVAAQSILLLVCVAIIMGVVFMVYRHIKKVLLTVGVCFLVAAGSLVCFAQNQGHVYSTWDTLELDTCASAWLIKNFVDKDAVFKFYPKGELIEEGIAFDTPDAEFQRSSKSSTFESILKKYTINDPVLEKIGKIIYDVEINYWGNKQTKEAQPLNETVLDIIKSAKTSAEAFNLTFSIFDELYNTIINNK